MELRVQWLEAKGSPVSPLDGVINERILPALQWAAVPQGKAGAAIGLINLIYPDTAGAHYESRFRIGTVTDRRLTSED